MNNGRRTSKKATRSGHENSPSMKLSAKPYESNISHTSGAVPEDITHHICKQEHPHPEGFLQNPEFRPWSAIFCLRRPAHSACAITVRDQDLAHINLGEQIEDDASGKADKGLPGEGAGVRSEGVKRIAQDSHSPSGGQGPQSKEERLSATAYNLYGLRFSFIRYQEYRLT